MRVKTAIFISLLWISVSAQAEPLPFYCMRPANIDEQIETDCRKNRFYVDAAKLCRKHLEQEVRKQQSLLSVAMAARGKAAADAQDARVENLNADLANTRAVLEKLIAFAERIRAEMIVYSKSFLWPGAYTDEEVQATGMGGHFSTFPCYHDNQVELKKIIKDVEKKIAELEATAAAAGLKLDKGHSIVTNLGASKGSLTSPLPMGNRGGGARLPVPKGNSTRKGSDITGVKEDQEKRKK
ncbi:MAG TPA: hypothetical protein VIH99_10330 [Bdellovibrionota bacterium]|jgi:hypothetical protein